MSRRLSAAAARRLAIAASGLAGPRPTRVDVRHLRTTLRRLAVVQIDSVNVVTRAHHVPFWSRLGAVDRDRLDAWLWGSGEVFEYLAHEASLVPVEHHPLLRHRMAEPHPWRRIQRLEAERPGYVRAVLDEVAERGPLAANELADGGSRTGPWWGQSHGKVALEYLYASGQLAIATRRPTFVTVYDLPERVLPATVLARPTPPPEEALEELVLLGAAAQGVGTARDLADHFRLPIVPARAAVERLVAHGRLVPVEVDGWRDPAFLHPDAVVPRRVGAAALLCPFDPLIWYRDRVERLFGVRYRIEIYVPEAQRVHGYYVLPFLLGDRIAARVDLKADRAAGALRVRAAHLEPDHVAAPVAEALADELQAMAAWLGVPEVRVEPSGDLAPELARAVARGGSA
ncbi:MAG TPA: crosslink repair DNA glycosylase YcaQ family protein [Acidimicrobiales bacterium]|nr:crosslink repair DNA glycosylase YcaQ family protein [Acidimicrobiales bacterium]